MDSLAFKIILAVSTLLVAAVVATNAVEAVRMRDPDYARMLEDRKRYEEVISKKGLSLHPAAYWKNIGQPEGAAPNGK